MAPGTIKRLGLGYNEDMIAQAAGAPQLSLVVPWAGFVDLRPHPLVASWGLLRCEAELRIPARRSHRRSAGQTSSPESSAMINQVLQVQPFVFDLLHGLIERLHIVACTVLARDAHFTVALDCITNFLTHVGVA